MRSSTPAFPPPASLTACAACSAVNEPYTAAFIRVKAPNALSKKSNISVEPLASLLEKDGCAAVPTVHALVDSIIYLSIANFSNSRVEIAGRTPVAAIAFVAIALNFPTANEMNSQLSRNDKLWKVLRELQIDTLTDSIPHKRPLVSIVCKYIDIFA